MLNNERMIDMQVVKTRKVGASTGLSIPKTFDIQIGSEFVSYKCKNGSLIFTPKIENPFSSDMAYEKDDTDHVWQEKAYQEMTRGDV